MNLRQPSIRIKSTGRKIGIAISLVLLLSSAFAQEEGGLVSVNLSVNGKGKPAICENVDSAEYYFVTVSIVNLQDTSVGFWIMDNCWPNESFFILDDSIMFKSCFNGCDHSNPVEIRMPPGKSVLFYATIQSFQRQASDKMIKVGFRYFATADGLWNYGTENPGSRKAIIYWSNEFELKENLYTYDLMIDSKKIYLYNIH